MRELFSLLRAKAGLAFLTTGIAVLAVTASFLWNQKVADMINLICEGNDPFEKSLLGMCGSILFVVLTEAAFTLFSGFTGEKMSEELRKAFACMIQRKKNTDLAEMNVGEQVSKLVNEVEEISNYITDSLFSLIGDFIKCIVTFLWLMSLNVILTLVTILPVFLILVYTIYSSRVLGALALQSQKARQQTNKVADTILELFPIMKLNHAEGIMLAGYSQATNRWVEVASTEEKKRSLLMSLSAILSCIPTLMMVLAGGRMVLSGEMRIGILYLFINMSANVTGFFMNMPGTIGTFRRFVSNFKSIASK